MGRTKPGRPPPPSSPFWSLVAGLSGQNLYMGCAMWMDVRGKSV